MAGWHTLQDEIQPAASRESAAAQPGGAGSQARPHAQERDEIRGVARGVARIRSIAHNGQGYPPCFRGHH